MIDALERLRDDWALQRGAHHLTDEPGWTVSLVMNGESIEWLGWGRTPTEAIEAAEAAVTTREREEAERRADYERRKAAGLLTPLEIASEHTGAIWSAQVMRAIETPSLLLARINRSYEGEVAMGDVIRISRPVREGD